MHYQVQQEDRWKEDHEGDLGPVEGCSQTALANICEEGDGANGDQDNKHRLPRLQVEEQEGACRDVPVCQADVSLL